MTGSVLSKDDLEKTDYLFATLETERESQIEIFLQMLRQLENNGLCRSVYHRLGLTLFNDDRLSRE